MKNYWKRWLWILWSRTPLCSVHQSIDYWRTHIIGDLRCRTFGSISCILSANISDYQWLRMSGNDNENNLQCLLYICSTCRPTYHNAQLQSFLSLKTPNAAATDHAYTSFCPCFPVVRPYFLFPKMYPISQTTFCAPVLSMFNGVSLRSKTIGKHTGPAMVNGCIFFKCYACVGADHQNVTGPLAKVGLRHLTSYNSAPLFMHLRW